MKKVPIQFSVVIPLYNKQNHILDTINCIRQQQKYPDEIIVVDDGSTDNSLSVLRTINDTNLKVISKKNGGVSSARNVGIEAAKNEFIALIDADDFWECHYLAEMEALIRRFPDAGIYSSAYQIIDEAGKYVTPKIKEKYLPEHSCLYPDFIEAMAEGDLPINMSSIVIRKSLFKKIGGFPLGEPMGEDQDFLFRAALAANIAYSPKMLSIYKKDSDDRACIRNVPAEECPFSKRLELYANEYLANDATRYKLKKCSAAHILYLAQQNIRANRLNAAERLLTDPRCKLKPLHLLREKIKLYIKKITIFHSPIKSELIHTPKESTK